MSEEEEPRASVWLLIIIPVLSLVPALAAGFAMGYWVLFVGIGGFWLVFYVSMYLLGLRILKKQEKESKHGS